MAKKIFLRDENNVKVLPITRGELILDSSGNPAFHSNEFLATDSQPGLMSPADKQKLETVAGNTVDTELSNTSTNPVQNKVLTQIINSIREKYLKSAVVSGNKVTITDQSNNTVEFVNSTYQIVTNAVDGLVPKYDAVDGTIDAQTTDWVLTNHNGTLGWYKLPTAAFSSSSVQLFVGAKSTSNNNNSNSATTNGNTYLKLFDNSTLKNQYNIKGTGLTTVISDASGTITINTPTSHNQASSDISSMTGYTKATAVAAIATTDSLNSALGKLELKADTTYELVKGAYDGDGTIENLAEILKVLDGIKDTETIQAIIGKYLPLTGGSLSGVLSINTGLHTNIPLNIYRGTTAPCISFHGGTTSTTKVYGYLGFGSENVLQCWNSDGTTGRIILHSGNSYINNGTITINGVSITPLTSKPSYAWSEITGKPTTVSGYGITDTFKIVDDGNAYLNLSMPSAALSKKATSTYIECWDGGDDAGWWNWKAGKWITVGGTSSHFVKGDGSLDSTTYATSASLGNYLPLSGGTLTNDNNILNLSGTTNSYIYYRLGSTNKASSGYYENFAFIANEKTYARIGVADDGTPQYHTDNHKTNVYTLLHSGIAYISNGTITINGVSITPLTSIPAHGIHWENFTKRATSSATWGTLTSAKGYTPIFWLDSVNGGGVAFSDYNGKTYLQIDGDYYANEGANLVLHTANYNSYAPTLTGTGASGTWNINISGSADKLDGYHAGLTNDSVAIFVPFPSYTSLKNSGYIDANYGTSSYGHPDDEFLKGICKWAIATYPNQGGITLMGAIAPNSSGTCILHLYSSSGKDSTTKLPRYCRGQYLTLNGYLYHFGTCDYAWSYNRFAFASEIKNPTNYYWADQLITHSAKVNATPTFGSVKSTGLITAQSGIQIGSTSDIGWYFYNSRICAGNSVARGVNTGSLLVSSAWADDSKVPTNGIYSKGNIITPANVQAFNLNLHGDWETDFGIHFNEGGDTKYGFSLLYGDSDLFKLVTRNTGTASTVFSVGRGSTQVDFKGKVTVANRLYPNEWIQFNNNTGLYWPNHPNTGIEMHIRPNTYSSYGGFAMYGKRGGYSGILLGTSNTNLCFMDDGNNSGLYIESLGKWIIYSLRSGNQIGIGTSSCTTNYGITLGSSTHIKGNLLINGESYCYTLTTNSSSNWVYLTKLLTGSSASGKSYEAGIGWHNTGGDGTGALTLVPHAQNTSPWAGTVGLYITASTLAFNGTAVSLSGHTHDDRYYTETESDGRFYPLAGSVNMSGDNKWIGSTMGGGTDYWRIGGYGSSDNGICKITIGDNSNDKFQIEIADYSGTTYIPLEVINTGINITGNAIMTRGVVGGYNNTSYALSTASFICNSWIRTKGATGWYNEDYTGGIYMEDSTWVRIYNGKKFYVSNSSSDAIHSAGGVYVAGAVHAYANYLKSTCNSCTVTIGSQNSSYCHYDTTAPQHWFNKTVRVQGDVYGGSGYNRRLAYCDEIYAYALPYNGWWSSGSGQNVDNANGMTFVYGNHGSPNGWGILCTFDYQYNSSYKFQLFAEGYSAAGMYYRCRSSDRGGWTDWKTVIDSGNIGSQSVNYATYSRYVYCTSGSYLNFQWSGQSGQPTWLFGSNDGANVYVWNPSNFSVNYANSAGSASYAHYLPTKYDGGQQTNPQTYFNNGIGLRVAMTGLSSKGTSYWSDTLWINGYSGGDAPNMCALHFNRDGTPRAFISTQSNQSSSYGTLYELITGYNIGSQSVNYANSAGSATNASNVYINTSATSSYYPVPFVTSTGAGNKALYIDSSTGTASSSAGVRYNPSSNALYCSGGFFEYSDETAKIFFNDIPVDFDILKRIPKKYFVWKDSHNTALQIGTSAQKLQEMYPELVTTVNGKLAVSYEKLSVVALKAIDELYDMIVELKQELNYYKTK